MSHLSEKRAEEYWRKTKRLMWRLMIIWFVVSFGFGILLVDVLNMIQIGGFKLGFWFAQQGAIYVFIGIIFYYVRAMHRLDAEYHVEEEDR
jgi:putative solute:sodium symporter small subunit